MMKCAGRLRFRAGRPRLFLGFLIVLQQFIFDGVDQGEPRGSDEVGGHSHGRPFVLVVAGFDEDADLRRGAGRGVYNTDFIVRERHFF